MKIFNLAFLFLFLFLFSCNQAVEVPKASYLKDDLHTQKTGTTSTANIVFRSADGGQTWQDISNGLPGSVKDDYLTANVFFADESGLYLANGNGIYHSEPNATAPFWTKAFLPDAHASITPGRNGIFAYSYGNGILQRTKGTNEWSPVFTDLKEKRVRSVLETDGGTLFVGTDKGLFRSTDGGKSWELLPAGGIGGKVVEANGVLLTTGMGIMRSTDAGANWHCVISEGGVGIDVERIKGGFAAINYSSAAKTRRIRTSYDDGLTWQSIDAGFPGPSFIDAPLTPVNVSKPAQGSADSGWHPKQAPPLRFEYKTSIIQVGENFFCGHTDGIYKTSDKGKTWEKVLCSIEGKMFILAVSGNMIYAIQTENHC